MTHKITDMLHSFEQQRRAIDDNRELSDIGKQNAKKKLDSLVTGYRSTGLIYLKGDWSRIRRQFKETDARRKEAEDKAARAWDYQRLNYEKSALEAQFRATGHDLQAVEKLYDSMANSGDRHKAKVAAEIGGATIFNLFGETNHDAQRLARRMRKDLEELTTTEELKEISQKESSLAKEALELVEVTKEASSYYGKNTGFTSAGYGQDGEFLALLEGVSISQKVQPDNMDAFIVTTIEIE